MTPRRILVIGSGPIQIGQACEFDYSGTQACLALKEEGYEVVLVNSNPASILTDATTAHTVYMEPLTPAVVAEIAKQEKVWAVAPSFGGQVALNIYMDLAEKGFWEQHGIKTLGVSAKTVQITEDRKRFQNVLEELGLESIKGGFVTSVDEGLRFAHTIGYPVIVRASFTLGGTGGGIAINETELLAILEEGFRVSPIAELRIEESIVGWKEIELEVMRDAQGCFLVVCGVENVNPMGVHTGDSVTVSPCMTLTDKEYQMLRDSARLIFDAVDMKIGGANIQFAIHPATGRTVVIEMNPRVSRSSALVSKATGYPIARIAARLAVGKCLVDLRNEVTKVTSAYFEPSIDYVAVKLPIWDTHKFAGASPLLGVQMKSVGEVLAFGRTFRDAFEKAWQSLERGFEGWPYLHEYLYAHGQIHANEQYCAQTEILDYYLENPTPALFPAIKSAFYSGYCVDKLHKKTKISDFFLQQLYDIFECEKSLFKEENPSLKLLEKARQNGFTKKKLTQLTGLTLIKLQEMLEKCRVGNQGTFRMVDTCAGEFEAKTPFYFKTFETLNENQPSQKAKVIIAGSGPNRIGQGVEFDTSCVHATKAARALGYETIMVNCNPETVSTDFLVSHKLFMEPVTAESFLDILKAEQPFGVFLQFGGQNPLKLASEVEKAGFRILGTSLESIKICEDRALFGKFMATIGIESQVTCPQWGSCTTIDEGMEKGLALGFPLLVRPSFVLGGQSMVIARNSKQLQSAIANALAVTQTTGPVLLDCYLEGAREYDLDLVCDGNDVFIPAIMEHFEEAGIHSGDSTSLIPPIKLSSQMESNMRCVSKKIATSLKVCGLLNIQFAVKACPQTNTERLYIIEVNPRSSRSVPFVSKATGIPLAELATKVALGRKLSELLTQFSHEQNRIAKFFIKTPIFPFSRFPGALPLLGPQMQSIGETMSVGQTLEEAIAKSFCLKGEEYGQINKIIFLGSPQAMFQMYEDILLAKERGFELFCESSLWHTLQDPRLFPQSASRPIPIQTALHCASAEDLHELLDDSHTFFIFCNLMGEIPEQLLQTAYKLLRLALRKKRAFSNSSNALHYFLLGNFAAKENRPNAETKHQLPKNWQISPISKDRRP